MSEINYTKGFNLGYDLASLSPEISKIILTAKSNDERIIGLQDGIAQYSLEIDETKKITQDKTTVKHRTPLWMKDERIENIDKETTQNKGKDMDKDIEPEV